METVAQLLGSALIGTGFGFFGHVIRYRESCFWYVMIGLCFVGAGCLVELLA